MDIDTILTQLMQETGQQQQQVVGQQQQRATLPANPTPPERPPQPDPAKIRHLQQDKRIKVLEANNKQLILEVAKCRKCIRDLYTMIVDLKKTVEQRKNEDDDMIPVLTYMKA